MSDLSFSVVIPVLNKWTLTRDCLQSLHEHTAEHACEVLVVDNGSQDETATELQPLGESLFGSRFRRIRFEENRNFGPACNAGAQAAASPLVFFLNNDTVVTPGWAGPLLDALAGEPSLGAVGPLLLYGDDTVQHLGVSVSAFGVLHLYRSFPADHPIVSRRRKLQALTAAALMMPVALFQECGGFYEGYRNGFEDVELSWRIRQRGKVLSCIPSSVVYHLESQSQGRKDSEDTNSQILRERCFSEFYTDLHHQGLRDGFSVGVDDFFEVRLHLSDEEEATLTREVQSKPAGEWIALTRRHPYWREGRIRVAETLEKKGKYAEALDFRAELTIISGTEESYRKLLRTATLAKNAATFAKAKEYFNLILSCKQSRDIAAGVMRKALSCMKNGQDPLLESLYTEKLRTMHP